MIRRHHGREPEMLDFINYIGDETLLASDALFSKEALKEYNEKQEKGTRRSVSYAVDHVKN